MIACLQSLSLSLSDSLLTSTLLIKDDDDDDDANNDDDEYSLKTELDVSFFLSKQKVSSKAYNCRARSSNAPMKL